MRQPTLYNSRNIFLLGGIFVVIFFLLFQLANFLHESQKINYEIDLIREQNMAVEVELQAKEQQLAYLQTPQRLDKEAKMQMGKKQVGEDVLIFVGDSGQEERSLGAVMRALPMQIVRTPLEQWRWLFIDRFASSK